MGLLTRSEGAGQGGECSGHSSPAPLAQPHEVLLMPPVKGGPSMQKTLKPLLGESSAAP